MFRPRPVVFPPLVLKQPMARVSTCLNFARNTEATFNYYRKVFGTSASRGMINGNGT